ncbi:Stk1 family PASTA domain-containing Ser/Thr kinase [Jeotgalibaca sp. A122]|uniref:Stk1 family PASTA domain-containing Ser/Thr kinase n=1 Tax=Jeotgalibaca sp. A122 TaxID=3457322 RepID=UPI003FD0F840
MIGVGTKIGGRYKVLSLLGTGGMAHVYLARDLILDRDVAVKILRFDFQNNKEALRRFQREALSTTQLIHPNIVSVYDVDEDDGMQYIVMEYIEGTDLKEYIQKHGKSTPEDAIHIMSQVLSAMALAHQNRIIHRDIKPQNLLISRDNTIKVTDFGIAVALSHTSITQTNSLLGSVHYISPEQARGSVTTTKSDIYALGIVLYELLSGEVPFDGESAVSIALKHFQEGMPSVRDKNAAVPQALENVILKATSKEPTDRYSTCEEMQQDLLTSLSPSRLKEATFVPVAMLDETKVLEPIKPLETVETKAVLIEDEPDSDKTAKKNERQNTQKKTKRGKLVTIFLVLFAALMVLLATLWLNRPPTQIEIPEVVNEDEETARRILSDLNFVIGDVHTQYHPDIDEGEVIRTNPESGELVDPETEIDLYISQGEEPVRLNDYVGAAYSQVRAELRDLGITVVREDVYDQSALGTIVKQSIAADTEVIPSETTITLQVSMEEEVFTMDNLAGFNQEQIEAFAGEFGLNLTIDTENSEDVAEGLMISQSISPRSNFRRGDELRVVISSGPAEPEIVVFSKAITIPYEAPKEESTSESSASDNESESSSSVKTKNHIVIYMADLDHQISEVFREFDIDADTQVTLNFRIREGETGSYTVERDGEVIIEETELTR